MEDNKILKLKIFLEERDSFIEQKKQERIKEIKDNKKSFRIR